MLQKFALAFKTKTIEFFAEEEEEYEDDGGVPTTVDLDSAEEIITGQRVVVIKPDKPNKKPTTSRPSHHHHLHQALVSSLFATVSSFHAAYLQLQTAHEPFHPDSIRAADRAAVSHLQRLSDLRRVYHDLQKNPSGPNPNLLLSSHLEAEVQENQSMLRKFETVFNRLQSDVDRKDAEASALKQQLREVGASNSLLERRLGRLSSSALDEGEKFLPSVGVYDALLKEACRAAHRFAKILIDLLKRSGWDLESAANSIYPGVDYAKRGHHGYTLLSYICLGMFGGFGTHNFGWEGDEILSNAGELSLRRREFLREIVKHCSIDYVELLSREPDCDFARFCVSKYQQLIHPDMESSLFGKFVRTDSVLGTWRPSNPLYEPFVSMSSLVWMLHKLAMAFDQAVEIFQVQRGVDFSMVYMESVVPRNGLVGSDAGRTRPKVGFTVVPGFRVGATVIQCKVYLNCSKSSS